MDCLYLVGVQWRVRNTYDCEMASRDWVEAHNCSNCSRQRHFSRFMRGAPNERHDLIIVYRFIHRSISIADVVALIDEAEGALHHQSPDTSIPLRPPRDRHE